MTDFSACFLGGHFQIQFIHVHVLVFSILYQFNYLHGLFSIQPKNSKKQFEMGTKGTENFW